MMAQMKSAKNASSAKFLFLCGKCGTTWNYAQYVTFFGFTNSYANCWCFVLIPYNTLAVITDDKGVSGHVTFCQN